MRVSEDIIAFENKDGSYVIYNKKNNHEIYMGKKEYLFLTELRAIASEGWEKNLNIGFPEQEKEKLLRLFEKSGLLECDGDEHKKEIRNISRLIISLEDKKTDKIFRKAAPFVNLISYGALPFYAFCFWISRSRINLYTLTDYFRGISPGRICCCIAAFILAIAVHELAHAVCAGVIGLHVVGFSMGLEEFIPNVKTVICGIRKIENKGDKIKYYLAGIHANMILAGAGMLICSGANVLAWNMGMSMVVCNLLILFANLFLIYNTDGFKMLLVLTELEDLSGLNMFSAGRIAKTNPKSRKTVVCYVVLAICCVTAALTIGG